jgi:hypothetical protein
MRNTKNRRESCSSMVPQLVKRENCDSMMTTRNAKCDCAKRDSPRLHTQCIDPHNTPHTTHSTYHSASKHAPCEAECDAASLRRKLRRDKHSEVSGGGYERSVYCCVCCCCGSRDSHLVDSFQAARGEQASSRLLAWVRGCFIERWGDRRILAFLLQEHER